MESLWLILILAFGLLFILLFSGMWISLALGAVGVFLLLFFVGGKLPTMIAPLLFNTCNSFTFTMLPLFIFMGEMILHSGLSEKLYKGANAIVGFFPGGLLHTNIASCAVFSAVCSSSMVTTATIGTIAIPEMERRGYDRRLLFGSIAGGGTLGILIPPSGALIIYGGFLDLPIGELFIGGVIPGVILTSLFIAYIAVFSMMHPGINPRGERFSLRAMVFGLVDILPFVVLIFMVLGTIYLGVATPTEAAGCGAFIALVFCAGYRKLTWQVLKRASLEAIKVAAWLMLIIIGASIFGLALSLLKVPAQLCQLVVSLELHRLVVLAFIIGLYLILGCIMDGISMILVTIPVVYPVMMNLGFDPIWYGILLVIVCEMGQLTPPLGLNLFVVYGITGKRYFGDILRGVLPFFGLQAILLVLLIAFPNLALWLPGQMGAPR